MIDWNDNISDEILAAYLDGNADAEETLLVESLLGNDPMISEVIDIVNDMNNLGLSMDNSNLVTNQMGIDIGWDYMTDSVSAPLLSAPEYNEGMPFPDSFHYGLENEGPDNVMNFLDNTENPFE